MAIGGPSSACDHRRPPVVPLVYQSTPWQHGTFLGATLSSETTAAATGKVGVMRRDSMAMLPFCGYNVADYWGPLARHGEADEESAEDLPRELVPDNGKFLWRGFGENLRVLKWALDRCQGRGKAEETDIGYVPAIDAIDRTGLEISDDAMRQLLRVDRADWIEVVQGQREYFEKFGDHLPAGIGKEHEALARRVAA